MKTLIVSDSKCDFVDVLESCGAETECIEFQKVLTVNLEDYDSFCILPEESARTSKGKWTSMRRLSGSKISGKAGERSGKREKNFSAGNSGISGYFMWRTNRQY